MIIELLSLLVNVISYFSVSPPWSPTLLICIFISSYVLSDYKKTTPFKLLWTLENYWTWWEIHFRTVTLTIITITIIIVIVMRIINDFFFIAGSTTATTRVISHQVFNRVAELLILANLLAIQLPLMVKRYNIDTHLRESNTLAKLTHPLTMLRDTCIRAMYTAIMKLEANIVCVNVSMLCKITSGSYLMSSFRGD